ncbi:MAG TPA: hypothetical protein VFI65_26205, partial [Streptosporangiaceae bacterium]|nr:hypothetical protein [Streptosporangiaceae bacterium]
MGVRTISEQRGPRENLKLANAALGRFFGGAANGTAVNGTAADGTAPRTEDRDEAEACLRAVLNDPSAPRRHRMEASFLLGGLLLTEHERGCVTPCAATNELREIVEILAIAGSPDGALARYVYLYALAADLLQTHTGDPADTELAISWLSRAAARWDVPAADRRRARLLLGVQYSGRAAALAAGAAAPPTPGSESWKAYSEAIGQFEKVLAKPGPNRPADYNRDSDRLDACLELLEVHYNRAAERSLSLAELGEMTGPARLLITTMAPDYPRRSYGLGRAGTVLIQRISLAADGSHDAELNEAIRQGRGDEIGAAYAAVPDFDADVEAAIAALSQAAGLEEHGSFRQPLFAMSYCAARAIRFFVHRADEDMLEIGRIARIVLGRPDIGIAYRRQCAEFLWTALELRLNGQGARSEPAALGPTAAVEIDTLITLLGRFIVDDAGQVDHWLSTAFVSVLVSRAGASITDAELAEAYGRLREAAESFDTIPALRATTLFQAATIGATWVRRGTAPQGLAADVAAAFDQAAAGLPRGHSLAREIARQVASFAQVRPEAAAASRPSDAPAAVLSRAPSPEPDEVDLRAVALIGAPSQGLLAAPGERIIELLHPLLS